MKIVAPAGNIERFYSAIKSGADEIYMGLKGFGARRNAENFTVEEIKEAIDYAHERGSRIFLTLNTVMKNTEIEFLYMNFKKLYEYGLDAVIVQDLGYFRFLKENFPDIDYHGSTQMTVANHVEANYLKKIGFKRVVLAREMSLKEIKSIKEKTDIELEVFVSGALCVSCSGNCYMSSFIGGRSGNRGMCAQPCRKEYTISGKKGYLLSPKDQLMGLKEINELKNIGINSIKIEGRMKQSNYIYEAVTYFKNLLNNQEKKNNIAAIFNRGYSKGYLGGNFDDIINEKYSFNIGKNIGIISGKELKLEDEIMLGDGITYYSKDFKNLGGEYINRIQKKNRKEKYKDAYSREIIILAKAPKGSKYVFKNFDKKINSQIETNLKNSNKFLEIDLKFEGKLNKKPVLEASCFNNLGNKINVKLLGDKELEKASKKEITDKEISEKLNETGGTSFKVINCKIDIHKGIFLPISILKKLRRDVLEELKDKLLISYRRQLKNTEKFNIDIVKDKPKHSEISAIVSNDDQEKILKQLGIKKIYKRGYHAAKENNLCEIDLNSNLASNLYQVLENKTKDIVVNWNLNVGNIYSLTEISKIKNVKTIILSPELSYEQIENIGKAPVRKAMLGYSKLLAMYIENKLFETDEILESPQGDKFISKINKLGNTEIYFMKSLNVLSQVKRLGKLGIDEVVIELLDETEEEIKFIVNNIDRKENLYSPYNYERGVF
ncbi:U32 family peptidase [Fusobacterium sp. MFO224]|uniref:peptidase U32 family protein n=1 Tax=Fusobacterium sp. MFO224 TaxID=3378070 RepID=UPI003854A85E